MPASPIPGMKVLSIGDIGSGKTTLMKTLIGEGLTVMGVFTEPAQEVLGDTDPEKLHWSYIKPVSSDIQNLIDAADKITKQTPDQVQQSRDTTRSDRNQYMPLLARFANYKCDRTGKEYGNISTWGTDKCLVLDSLSGLTIAALSAAVGQKYALTQPEFQIAQNMLENLVNLLTTTLQCHVYITAHPEMEVNEITGGRKIYPSTLGRKLAPKLPRNFSDVIQTQMVMDGTKPKWVIHTISEEAVLKARNFPFGRDMPCSFAPAMKKWKERGGIITPEIPK